MRNVPGHISLRVLLDLVVLEIDGKIDMRDAAPSQCGTAGDIRDLLDVRRSHDARIINGNVDICFVEIDVLLRMSIDKVMIVVPGDRKDWLPVELRIVEA